MTTKVRVEAVCDDNTRVLVMLTTGSSTRVIRMVNGQSAEFFIHGENGIGVAECPVGKEEDMLSGIDDHVTLDDYQQSVVVPSA